MTEKLDDVKTCCKETCCSDGCSIVILGIAVPVVAYRNVVPIQIPVVKHFNFIKNLLTL